MSANVLKQPITLLKSSMNAIISHPIILFPFCVVAFIQFLLLEILFFAPRSPLSSFFKPLIIRLEGEAFLHYPFNFVLLSKWFQNPWLQVPIYIFVTTFFIGAAVLVIDHINREENIDIRSIFKRTFSVYVHLVVAAAISVVAVFSVSSLHTLVLKRAFVIRSEEGAFFLIKKIALLSAPYVNLLIAVFITTLFAFVIPIIVIENKKIFKAIVDNFKNLWRSFLFVFVVVLMPALLYLPIVILRTNKRLLDVMAVPELWGFLLIFGILMTLFIDAIQYTAITTYFLLKREEG